MHMSDALISAPVAIAADIAAAAIIAAAASRLKRSGADSSTLPVIGVMGAFVFAAQMLNFSIPATGSSGHIVGGVLLAAVLGPWASFVALAGVITIQCLLFADGGLMALGCNILNMAAMSTLVAYPLLFKPFVRSGASRWRVIIFSVIACVAALELGALMVVGETCASGISALPTAQFIMFMLPIHLVIGICEGLATAAVLCFLQSARPDLLWHRYGNGQSRPVKRVVICFAVAALVAGGGLAYLASSNPDGLEWSVAKVTGDDEFSPQQQSGMLTATESIQSATALMPGYSHSLSGIAGAAVTMLVLWGGTALLVRHKKIRSGHD